MSNYKTHLISIEHDIAVSDLIYQIARSLDPDDIIRFIKELDLAAQDWYVTKSLNKHFQKVMKKLDEEKGLKNTQEKK